MRSTTITGIKLKRIAERFQLDLMVLFGSQATRRVRSDSDVDIAVRTHTPRHERNLEWETDLWSELSDLWEQELDLVMLNDASPLLLFEVACDGKPLYESSSDTFLEFQLYAAKRHYDNEKFYRLEWIYVGEDIRKAA